jgi:hygromycin-B 4-O-kinase
MEHAVWNRSWAEQFLAERYGEAVADVEFLKGGSWSTAFGFRHGGRRYVLRLGQHGDDYRRDELACRWASPLLPIPAVEAVELLPDESGWVAITHWHQGEPIDALPPERMPDALESMFRSLDALQSVPMPGRGFGIWDGPSGDAPCDTWSGYLISTRDRDDARLAGWRSALAAHPEVEQLFFRGFERLAVAAASLPTHRNAVHSDLLYGNVLVDQRNNISAMFDWGCSLAGDPVYDAAWVRVWAPFHPGIEPTYVTELARFTFGDDDLEHRMRAYEMHILLAGIQYQAFAGLTEGMALVVPMLQALVD